jgi:hypothetical protein
MRRLRGATPQTKRYPWPLAGMRCATRWRRRSRIRPSARLHGSTISITAQDLVTHVAPVCRLDALSRGRTACTRIYIFISNGHVTGAYACAQLPYNYV